MTEHPPIEFAIVGAGLVGLTLALALKEHCGITAQVFERATDLTEDLGAGLGMYANGLRVIRDLDEHGQLLKKLRAAGHRYEFRRWDRHNGHVIMVAQDDVLTRDNPSNCREPTQEELMSLGIRRVDLLRVLYEAVQERNIPVHSGKNLTGVEQQQADSGVKLQFEDGSSCFAGVVFGVDGVNSTVRRLVTGDALLPAQSGEEAHPDDSRLKYTGVTCLMGMSPNEGEKAHQGICFPSSTKTKCHASFFPTSSKEQCFQFYFPTAEGDTDKSNWGNLSESVGKQHCNDLASQLREDGWDEQYIQPLDQVNKAVKVGFCVFKEPLEKWVYGRVVLVGDSCHPPTTYTGQGAQQGLEDAGTVALLMKALCVNKETNKFQAGDFSSFAKAMQLYESIRVPQAKRVMELATAVGRSQRKRAESMKYEAMQRDSILKKVFDHETIPEMLVGTVSHYAESVQQALQASS